LVAYPLVDAKIEAGEVLVQKLDDARFPLKAAFWIYLPEPADWRLVLASPIAESPGRLEAYRRVQQLLLTLESEPAFRRQPIALREITVVEPNSDLAEAISTFVNTGPGISGVRLSRSVINGIFIEDAYIYRSS
jgi:hypothetical protein